MSKTVIGIFDNAAEAKKAVDELKNIGFGVDKVDVSNSSPNASTTGTTTSDYNEDDSDSIGSFFRSLFTDDEDDARTYSAVARRSSATVTVHAQSDEEARRAAEVMDRYGSVDVGQRASEYGLKSKGAAHTGHTNSGTEGKSIPIIEENLEVGKREVETGGARLRSRIVERPVEEHLRLRTEHVRVERNQVNRPASEADFNNFQEGEIEITEHAEVPVVNKNARVVEEISLDKEVEERDETIRGTVRSTEVDVDRMDGDRNQTNRPGQNPTNR